MKYDFIVIGAGIAGVAISELLQRSGKRVLLLEEQDKVCSSSSAQQQGWFHAGALYAALPTNEYFKALVTNLDAINMYYSNFKRMNLSRNRQLATITDDGWFNNSAINYLYASPSDPTIALWQKPIWLLAIIRAQGRLSWFESLDFSRDIVPQMDSLNFSFQFSKVVQKNNFDFTVSDIYKILIGKDRTMNSEYIASDLINSFISHGGELKLRSKVTDIFKQKVVTAEGVEHQATNIILSAGSGIKYLTSLKVKTVASPLLVIKPAITNVNIVKMHINMPETINHIYHKTSDGDYSVIGNAVYYDAESEIDLNEVHTTILNKVNRIFNESIDINRTSLYLGYKTELTNKGQLRNYQSHIIGENNCTVVLPGKMTLAFSLAVNVCKRFGVDPCPEFASGSLMRSKTEVSKPIHYYKYLELP